MIDPVSRYYVLHEQAHPGYGAPSLDSAVLRQLAAEIRREENEACALVAWEHAREIRKGRHTGTRCDEIAEDIRARMAKP